VLVSDHEAEARASALLRDMPEGYRLIRAEAEREPGQRVHLVVLLQRPSGACLSVIWQSLLQPVALRALHFLPSDDVYSRQPDGTELVLMKRNWPDSVQALLIHPDGRMCNGIGHGVPGRGVPAPMGIGQLRSLIERHA
jgi:hypothetical protein